MFCCGEKGVIILFGINQVLKKIAGKFVLRTSVENETPIKTEIKGTVESGFDPDGEQWIVALEESIASTIREKGGIIEVRNIKSEIGEIQPGQTKEYSGEVPPGAKHVVVAYRFDGEVDDGAGFISEIHLRNVSGAYSAPTSAWMEEFELFNDTIRNGITKKLELHTESLRIRIKNGGGKPITCEPASYFVNLIFWG